MPRNGGYNGGSTIVKVSPLAEGAPPTKNYKKISDYEMLEIIARDFRVNLKSIEKVICSKSRSRKRTIVPFESMTTLNKIAFLGEVLPSYDSLHSDNRFHKFISVVEKHIRKNSVGMKAHKK